VWYPDSAFKTAQAIRDFNRGEGLPLVIFANWRGFSGGTRDMFAEVLKYGAMIVDALVDYKHPVTIYIPPNGELRGGAWVVLDPKINEESIEMFADVDARGGILEPAGATEIVFKKDKQVVEMMHRCDEQLRDLNAKKTSGQDVAAAIQQREKLLLPLYQQVSQEYCDLHDRCPRMKSLGAIREGLHWADSRSYLHWRIRRRVQENSVARRLMRTRRLRLGSRSTLLRSTHDWRWRSKRPPRMKPTGSSPHCRRPGEASWCGTWSGIPVLLVHSRRPPGVERGSCNSRGVSFFCKAVRTPPKGI